MPGNDDDNDDDDDDNNNNNNRNNDQEILGRWSTGIVSYHGERDPL